MERRKRLNKNKSRNLAYREAKKIKETAESVIEKTKKEKKDISILPTLIRCFGVDFAWTAILTALSSILQFASPQIVQLLIGLAKNHSFTS